MPPFIAVLAAPNPYPRAELDRISTEGGHVGAIYFDDAETSFGKVTIVWKQSGTFSR